MKAWIVRNNAGDHFYYNLYFKEPQPHGAYGYYDPDDIYGYAHIDEKFLPEGINFNKSKKVEVNISINL